MRSARINVHAQPAGVLIEHSAGRHYSFHYDADYEGPPVSLTMPCEQRDYDYEQFPAFFDGLLPEGIQLEALLKQAKIDRYDYFAQLVAVGQDMVGNVTVYLLENAHD
jgi:serine/threonine-protein kinase HipA